jgi:hypothetical protein
MDIAMQSTNPGNKVDAPEVPPPVSQREGVRRLPIDGLSKHLPHRFPVGATYVIEGYGGEGGNLRVISRYVVLPGGLRINVPADISQPPAPRPCIPAKP